MNNFSAKKSKNWRFYNAANTHGHKECYNIRQKCDFSIFSRFLRRLMKSDMVVMPNQVYIRNYGCVSFEMRYWKAKLSKNWRFYNAAKTHGHKECYNAKKSNFRFFRFFSIFLGWIMKSNLVRMPSKVVYVFSEYIGSVLVCFWRKKSDFWWFFIAVSTHIGKKKEKKAIFRFFDFFAISTPSNEVGHGCHAKPSLYT